MTVNGEAWKRREALVSEAFGALADRVRPRIPELVSRGTSSSNRVKHLSVVRTFGLPGKHDDALVLSTMFTTFGGTLNVHCDLMKEDGPILRELGSRDLGAEPAEEKIDAAVAAVVAFATSSAEEIVAGLEAQRGE